MNYFDPEGELPTPEIRERRADAHFAWNQTRQKWYNAKTKVRAHPFPGNRFQYSRLERDEIRLLRILPYGEDGVRNDAAAQAPLEGQIFSRKLSEVRNCYEAISYCWGDISLKPTHDITIRNLNPRMSETDRRFSHNTIAAAVIHLKKHRFPIYKNLSDALLCLRGRLKPVIVWVDAICIDQSEAGQEEKRQQLRMMDQIYLSAANVCVWLGTGFDGSSNGFRLARELTNFQTLEALIANADNESRWPDLIKLLELPWFQRRWIIQEIALAHNASLHCGTDRMHWDDFTEAISLLMANMDNIRRRLNDEIFENVENTPGSVLIETVNSVCRKSDQASFVAKVCDLETLVSTLLGFQATYPKDAIFSVVSLAEDPPLKHEAWEDLHANQLNRLRDSTSAAGTNPAAGVGPSGAWNSHQHTSPLSPDNSGMLFRNQLSTRDVFIAFVTRSIMCSGSLDILCRYWAPPVLDKYGLEVPMPSWVQPLSRSAFGLSGTFKGRQYSDNLVAYRPGDHRKRYKASGKESPCISMIDEANFASPTVGIQRRPTNPLVIITNSNNDVDGSSVLTNSPLASPVLERPGSAGRIFMAEPESTMQPNGLPGSLNGISSAHQSGTSTPPPTENTRRLLTASMVRSARIVAPIDDLRANGSLHDDVTQDAGSAGLQSTNGSQPRSTARSRSSSTVTRQAQAPDIERAHFLSGIMSVRGFVVGTVVSKSDVMRGGIVPGEWVRELGWAGGDSNSVPDLLWRTLVADRTPAGGVPPVWYKRACLHALVDPRKTDADGNLHTVTPADRQIAESITNFLQRVESVVWNRRLFRVEVEPAPEGYEEDPRRAIRGPLYGVCPSGTDNEDLVCILYGCSVPVVLGKSSRDGVYRLHGEAYVHGIMDGEAMKADLDALGANFLLE